MLMSEKLAVPALAATLKVPDKVPVLGLLFIASVIESVSAVLFPKASWISTSMAGDTFTP
jgi:hypothetical protein